MPDQEAMQNPFSREKAYLTFLKNTKRAAFLKEEIRIAQEKGNRTDREMLLMAAEALGCLTDNTILERIVQKALESRNMG